ncbi:MAG: S1 RNA-binding domain-containing protein, partial [Anaerolineae bacterium]|nr:S1 RNA-binding domain-containing protein [Anaerolineae bacterium]
MEQNRVSGLKERFKALLQGGEYDYARPRPGDVIEAVIVTKSDYELIVDLGIKRDGLVPASDLSSVDEAYVDSLESGDTIPVVVMRRGLNQADIVRVSLSRGLQQQDWLRAQELLETGEIVEAPVVDTNRGGVLVDFGRIRGFVPNS